MRNVFGYRLASLYLTSTGVFVLSSSQRDFIKSYSQEYQSAIGNDLKGWKPSTELIDMQTVYLGVMMGERDHTDLNSWPIVALSR